MDRWLDEAEVRWTWCTLPSCCRPFASLLGPSRERTRTTGDRPWHELFAAYDSGFLLLFGCGSCCRLLELGTTHPTTSRLQSHPGSRNDPGTCTTSRSASVDHLSPFLAVSLSRSVFLPPARSSSHPRLPLFFVPGFCSNMKTNRTFLRSSPYPGQGLPTSPED